MNIRISGVSGLYGPIKFIFFSRDWTSLKLHWIHYLQKTEKTAKNFGCIFAEAFKNNKMEKQLFFQEIFQAKSHFPKTVTFPQKCFKLSIVPLILNVHLDNFVSYTFGILSKAYMAFVTNGLSYCFLDFICILALIVIRLSFSTVNEVYSSFVAEIYADPSHSSFKALNFVSGVSTTFTPSVWSAFFSIFYFIFMVRKQARCKECVV